MASLFELLGSVKWEDLEGYKSRESGVFEYSNSKIMVIMAAREMNKRLKVNELLSSSMCLIHDIHLQDDNLLPNVVSKYQSGLPSCGRTDSHKELLHLN